MAAFPLEAGEVFADRYRIVRVVASGGMGAVYEAVHTVTERRCALKVMLAHTVQREKLRERFMLESKLAAQIGSEYIVDILDAGVDEKTKSPYLVMELLEGEDLAQRLVRLGRFSPLETVTYLWHAALALDRTHRSSIVHRDLKASNLFLTHREDGSPLVKVLDFGVAKVMPMESGNEGHTQTVGTPIYMAPEQFRAGGRVSPATDIYALGMLAYTMLVGSHYWAEEHQSCENPFAFASVAVKGPKDPATVRAHREGVQLPAAFDEWFARATSRVPGERFASATEAVEELAVVLAVSMPAVSSATNAVPTPPSSVPWVPPEGAVLDETVESRSAVLSQGGLGGGSSGSLPIVVTIGTEPSQHDPLGTAKAERTEISLSVTSGELDPEEHARQRRRSQLRKGSAAVAVLALLAVAVVVGRRLDAADDVQVAQPSSEMALAKKPPEPTLKPTAEARSDVPAAPAPAREPPSEEASPTNEDGIPIRSLEELPRATTDSAPATAPRPRYGSAPRRQEAPAPAPVTKTTASPAPTHAPAPAAEPAKPSRVDLYGRE
jgi:eukaryotic-like serine/threonine-protein kinase